MVVRISRFLLIVVVCFFGGGGSSAQQTVGLFQNDPDSYDGYTLFAPMGDFSTYLINNEGRLVHSWAHTMTPGLSVYLLEDGTLLRPASVSPNQHENFTSARGGGGRVEAWDWDGTLLWAFDYSSASVLQHHDVEILPNGNVLVLAWVYKTDAEAIAAGKDPAKLDGELAVWPESVIEIQPTPPTASIVWEWHMWDHLI